MTNVFSSEFEMLLLRFFVVFFSVEAKCDDLDAIRSSMAAVTIVYVLIAIFSLTGSIYGCVGTCCAPQVKDVSYIRYGITKVVPESQNC